jgi:N-alpha-acetyltransferase 15/16, NatA auxiliary subunit
MAAKSVQAIPIQAQPLTGKENARYKEILTMLDEKNYKKAIKLADQILEKVPNHGETLAVKALCLHSVSKKTEGYNMIKEAIKNNIKSLTTWHIYGMIHRADDNYAEAIKCYRQCLRIDPVNQQILRDISTLQVHTRDYRGHHESRKQLLMANPIQVNWIGLSVAHYLANNTELAFAVVESHEQTISKEKEIKADDNERFFYKIRILEQMGDYARALEMMKSKESTRFCLDSVSSTLKLSELLLKSGDHLQALEGFLSLILINPENYVYHRGLQTCILKELGYTEVPNSSIAIRAWSGLYLPTDSELVQQDSKAIDVILAIYLYLVRIVPKSRAIRRIPLQFLSAEHPVFPDLMSHYVRSSIRKGIPSLFTELKSLYRRNSELGLSWSERSKIRSSSNVSPTLKSAIIEKVLMGLFTSLQNQSVYETPVSSLTNIVSSSATVLSTLPNIAALLPPIVLQPSAVARNFRAPGDGDVEDPSVLPWLCIYAAKHFDELGNLSKALEYLDIAQKHTPTVIDIYVTKARVLKHKQEFVEAASCIDYARTLDLADRFLNTKTVKYFCLAAEHASTPNRSKYIEDANKLFSLFTKHDSKDPLADPLGNVREMQVMHWERQLGRAYEAVGDYNLALKHFRRVDSHFSDWIADQLDFHAYVLRGHGLRAYLDTSRLMDVIKSHAFCQEASLAVARIYFLLSKNPGKHQEYQKLYASHLETLEAQRAADKSGATYPRVDKDGKKIDEDLTGLELAACASPLEEAAKWIKQCSQNLPVVFKASVDIEASNESIALRTATVMPTPTGGSAMSDVSSRFDVGFLHWNITPEFAYRVHSMAIEISLARKKPLLGMSHLSAIQNHRLVDSNSLPPWKSAIRSELDQTDPLFAKILESPSLN